MEKTEHIFKVGDKVRIRKHTASEKNSYLYGWNRSMSSLENTEQEITWVSKDGEQCRIQGYEWSTSSLEPVEVEDKTNWHKHYDLIVTWAKGATIEYQPAGCSCWEEIKKPTWDGMGKYRIKPKIERIRISDGEVPITEDTVDVWYKQEDGPICRNVYKFQNDIKLHPEMYSINKPKYKLKAIYE